MDDVHDSASDYYLAMIASGRVPEQVRCAPAPLSLSDGASSCDSQSDRLVWQHAQCTVAGETHMRRIALSAVLALLLLAMASILLACSTPGPQASAPSAAESTPASGASGLGDTSAPATQALPDTPESTDFWTVVIESLPDTTADEGTAAERASAAEEAGVDAMYLRSSDYQSLKPGYWVVCVGEWPDQALAKAQRTSVVSRPRRHPRQAVSRRRRVHPL
jgi:hypothetical protein